MYVSGHPLDKYFEKIKYRCNCEIIQLNDLRKLKNKNIVLGGMVTDFEERETRNGNKYGVLTIEDFTSSKQFRIFKNYDSFNTSFFELGAVIEISAIVEKNYYNDDLVINIGEIKSLDRDWRMISVNLEVDDIKVDIIQKLEDIVKHNKGKTNLEINLFLSKKNIFVPLRCNTFQIKYSEKFKKEINKIGIKEYFLN